jgi:hypothetical protein
MRTKLRSLYLDHADTLEYIAWLIVFGTSLIALLVLPYLKK